MTCSPPPLPQADGKRKPGYLEENWKNLYQCVWRETPEMRCKGKRNSFSHHRFICTEDKTEPLSLLRVCAMTILWPCKKTATVWERRPAALLSQKTSPIKVLAVILLFCSVRQHVSTCSEITLLGSNRLQKDMRVWIFLKENDTRKLLVIN